MLVTNRHGVPDVIFRAAQSDKYSRGIADVSVTQLIDAPQISRYRERYSAEISVDVVDRLWSLLGTAVHSLLENASDNQLVEERLFVRAGTLIVSGAIDVQEDQSDGTVGILDFKVTSVTSVMYGKDSWHKQLNCYAYLVRKNKAKTVSKLQICAILRDWKRADMLRDARYPRAPIVTIDIPIWPDEEQERYFEERAAIHARSIGGEEIPCAPDERWQRPTKWAVKKSAKSKRASRTFSTEEEALAFVGGGDYIIEHRPGTCTRCEQDFCQVAKWCKQWEADRPPDKPDDIDGWL